MDAALAAGESLKEAFPVTIGALNFAFGGLSLAATIVCVLVMLPYDLDKKYPQIRAELDARQKKND